MRRMFKYCQPCGADERLFCKCRREKRGDVESRRYFNPDSICPCGEKREDCTCITCDLGRDECNCRLFWGHDEDCACGTTQGWWRDSSIGCAR